MENKSEEGSVPETISKFIAKVYHSGKTSLHVIESKKEKLDIDIVKAYFKKRYGKSALLSCEKVVNTEEINDVYISCRY